ncbi:MAG: RNA polymerase sigma factor [Myxococcaceae bacterium]
MSMSPWPQQMGQLYARFAPAVYRRALAIVRSESDARDILQEVFSKAMKSPIPTQSPGESLAWLYRVTTNASLNWLRLHRVRTEFSPESSDDQALLPRSTEARDLLQRLAQTVPERTFSVAMLHFFTV